MQPRPPTYAEATEGKFAADYSGGRTAEGPSDSLRVFNRGGHRWRRRARGLRAQRSGGEDPNESDAEYGAREAEWKAWGTVGFHR